MTETPRFQYGDGSVNERYDSYFVPALFGPWAELLLDAAKPVTGELVVDIATGPGTVARLAAARVGRTGKVIAADIAEPMLAIARNKPEVSNGASIEYVASPASPLAIADGVADLCTCQQGLQFFPDPIAALRQMHRVLKPNGRVAIAVWAPIEEAPIFAAIKAALGEVVPPATASLMGAPFAWGSAARLVEALTAAGFRDVEVTAPSRDFTLEGGAHEALRVLGAGPLAPHVQGLNAEQQSQLTRSLEAKLTALREGHRVRAPIRAFLGVAKR